MPAPLNVAIIGYGFMGRAHSNAYRQVGRFFDLPFEPVLKVASARTPEALAAFAARWGWQETDTDWRRVVERPDVDLVDICTPNSSHREIALAALAAGKMVACEKPLAMDAEEGAAMVAAAEAAGRPTMVWFNYRRVPAMALARQLVDEGRIGRPYHLRSRWLQDWTISPEVPQGGAALWRLERATAGSGVTGDLLAHSIDQAMWLNGPIDAVAAVTETFVTERELQDRPGRAPAGGDPTTPRHSWRGSPTARSAPSRPRATRAGARTRTTWRSTAMRGRSPSTSRTRTCWSTTTTATTATCAAGGPSRCGTAITPTWPTGGCRG